MQLSSQQKTEICKLWADKNPQFKRRGRFLYRLTDFLLTIIELRFFSSCANYEIFIQTHTFYENRWGFSIDSEKHYRFSLGRHPDLAQKYGVRYLGNELLFENFSFFLKDETILRETMNIDFVINNFENYRGVSNEIPPLTMYALGISYYFKGGATYAFDKLDFFKENYNSLFKGTREIFGGSWVGWKMQILNDLNINCIQNNKSKFISDLNIKLQNYPIYGCCF